MLRNPSAAAAFFAALVVASAMHAGAARGDTSDGADLKARLQKLDSGPKTIDVSKYPAEQKAGYGAFAKRCSKCHTLARPINSDFALPAQWERYIKRMMYKPNSEMSEKDSKTIYRFLVYDRSVRKADQLRKALAALPAAERTEAVAKVKAVNPAFTVP